MLTVAMNNTEFEQYHRGFLSRIYNRRTVDMTLNKEEQSQTKQQIPEDQKNGLHIQWYEQNGEAFEELIEENPVAARIFSFLSRYMDNRNAVVCPSSILEEAVDRKRTTVSKAVTHLSEKGWLTILKVGTTNTYILNPNVVWRAWRGGKSYCEFDGPILISKKENKILGDKFKQFKTNQIKQKDMK